MTLTRLQWCILLGAFALLIAGAALYSRLNGSDAESVARRIVAACKESPKHDECYESKVPQLYPATSIPDILSVIRDIRAQDPSYQFCHVLAHKLGERVVAEDPDHWRDAIAYNPSDGLCSNGFIHGVVGGRFRSEVLSDATIEKLIPDFSLACQATEKWHPTDFDSAVCYHGMGHLYDFITDANLMKAVDLCKRTTPKEAQRTCIEGVFMQIYQPLEPDDYALIDRMPVKPTKETVRIFCAAYKDPVYVGSCMSESWPFFNDEILDGSGAAAFCAGYPNAEEEQFCWLTISSIVGRMSLSKPDQAVHACNAFPERVQGICYAGSAQAVIEEQRTQGETAVALCERAPIQAKEFCLSSLAEKARFIYGDSDGLQAFCAMLPAEYATSCISGVRSR